LKRKIIVAPIYDNIFLNKFQERVKEYNFFLDGGSGKEF
jgi:hypothetical protein